MKPNIITAVIVDDEQEAINLLVELTKDMENLQVVSSTTDPDKVLTLCLKHQPDLLFLDIQMPRKDGFAVIRELKENQLFPRIIFATAFDKFSLMALKEGALDYILKPIDRVELSAAIQKVRNYIDGQDIQQRLESLEKAVKNHRKLRFNTRSGFILVHPDEIFYIHADANYSEIFTSKTDREVISMNLGAVEAMLPEQFIRISRSLIINSVYLSKLSGVNRKCLLHKNEDEIEFCVPEKQISEIRKRIGEV
ncbi:MAG: response regulator transcription factor [Bacteroidales bacterium]|nr:response regulator transcription factor [Bacteroidales bacterium]